LIATVEGPEAIRAILAALGGPAASLAAPHGLARGPALLEAVHCVAECPNLRFRVRGRLGRLWRHGDWMMTIRTTPRCCRATRCAWARMTFLPYVSIPAQSWIGAILDKGRRILARGCGIRGHATKVLCRHGALPCYGAVAATHEKRRSDPSPREAAR
jgi:hypothetical protein